MNNAVSIPSGGDDSITAQTNALAACKSRFVTLKMRLADAQIPPEGRDSPVRADDFRFGLVDGDVATPDFSTETDDARLAETDAALAALDVPFADTDATPTSDVVSREFALLHAEDRMDRAYIRICRADIALARRNPSPSDAQEHIRVADALLSDADAILMLFQLPSIT